jgi:hypothetical protein
VIAEERERLPHVLQPPRHSLVGEPVKELGGYQLSSSYRRSVDWATREAKHLRVHGDYRALLGTLLCGQSQQQRFSRKQTHKRRR